MPVAALPRSLSYDQATASMLVDPEAPLIDGGASVSSSALPAARCARGPAVRLDWIPDLEAAVVPGPMQALCTGCLGRLSCLTRAVATRSQGYWAGTTTADRNQLVAAGRVDLAGADALQAAVRAVRSSAEVRDGAEALHPAGQGSLRWYRRRGCRCAQCRRCNADHRAAQRAAARQRAAAA